jgi:hypothetical protein
MGTPRIALVGRRGWVLVASLTLALGAIVGTQTHTAVAHADLSPAAQTAPLSPSVAAALSQARSEPAKVAVTTPRAEAASAPTNEPANGPAMAAATPARAAKAPAAGQDVCSGPDVQVRRGQAALATLRDTGQRSGVSVSFKGAKDGYLGLTYPAAHHVDVFVRPCSSESWTLLRHVLSHEMGHAYDAAHMTDQLRADYLKMRGIPAGTPWFGCSYCSDFATPAGDFAETYSQWQRGSHDSRTQIAPMPNDAQLAAIAATFFGA